ncbi:unnamed protein product [Ixodes persulcatus]
MSERELENPSPEKPSGAERLLIESHSVAFPYTPYPSQKLVIVRVLQGLKNGRNCLIESPTGSGKTLALLCSCLAWQANQKGEVCPSQLPLVHGAQQSLNLIRMSIYTNTCPLLAVRMCKRSTSSESGSYARIVPTPHVGTAHGHAPHQPGTPAHKIQSTAGTPVKGSAPVGVPGAASPVRSNRGAVPNPWLETGQSIVVNGQLVPVVTQAYLDSLLACGEKPKTPSVAVRSATPSGQKTPGAANAITIDDDDDFQPAKKPRHSVSVRACDIKETDVSLLKSKAPVSTPVKETGEKQPVCTTGATAPQTPAKGIDEKPIKKVPIIYYGTRTHKQIAQVVRELKKTEYRNARMCILSSRERTCIHPRISRSSNKNEECKELLDDGRGRGTQLHRHDPLCNSGVRRSFAEDLFANGPSFARSLLRSIATRFPDVKMALVPANAMLVDPRYKDICYTEESKKKWAKATLVAAATELMPEDCAQTSACPDTEKPPANTLWGVFSSLSSSVVQQSANDSVSRQMSKISVWISQHSDHLNDYRSFEQSGKVWSGNDIIALMIDIGLGPEAFESFRKTVTFVTSIEKDPEKYQPMLLASTSAILQNLVIILDFFYRSNMKYMSDFRTALATCEGQTKHKDSYEEGNSAKTGGWHTKSSPGSNSWTHTLSFWCLNPAVAMSDIKDKVHSLIVASGTLSPMESFESELDMPFKSQLQAKHVIPPDGVWIGGIACGPSKLKLTANYRTVETYLFQDEIGTILLDICKTVPFGVLCFFTSYSMMNKLVQRWRNTGMWDNISEHKCIFVEPQKADAASFDASMVEYCRYATREAVDVPGTGALLLAVCRGKVSEGMDFADNTARAVVTVGIPFPNVKDIQVDQKRKYNDQCSKSGRPVMCGNFWYETQAFRALNQALGRCIRHRLDWGALIVVDQRFSENSRYQKGEIV